MYTQMIREALAAQGRIGVNPLHVEAWMRVEHGTLDHLSPSRFRSEVRTATACMDASTIDTNNRLAQSYGLGA
jgi:hypothetical protein